MERHLQELNVLLVEDEKNLAQLLKSAIGENFASFSIASNGKEGIERFLKLSPDLVITDIMMPEMTGLEMAEELRKINPDIHIIILSAFSEKEKLLGAIDVGVMKYFIKPFDPDELLEYIKSISSKLKNNLIILEDDFKFNKETNNLYKDDKYVALTKRESIFLQLLIKNPKDMISNEIINKELWNDGSSSEERLRTFIKRFRLKTSKKLINNIKGQGYQLVLV
jgi:DNA-binding response OmpR family regulator